MFMKGWLAWGIVIAIVCLAVIAPRLAANAASASGSSTMATAYQVNAQHNGRQTDTIAPPLSLKWTTTLAGKASYPLIAGGQVFITAITSQGEGLLYAFNLSTGQAAWGPIDLGNSNNFAAATYDAGSVFTLNGAGILEAFSAAAGAKVWIQQITTQYLFTSPPTALNGMVYVGAAGSGGTVYGFKESNGSQVWTQPVENGDDSAPTVSGKGVYVSYACNQAFDFAPKTGTPVWHYSPSCEGGGGATTALYNNRLYTRDNSGNLILNAFTGKLLGTYSASQIPAFSGTTGYFLNGSTLSAESLSTHTVLWTFKGDGALVTAPLVDGAYVYIGSSKGNLYALDATTGTQVWTTKVGAAMGQSAYASLAAAEQVVAVPAGAHLSIYG